MFFSMSAAESQQKGRSSLGWHVQVRHRGVSVSENLNAPRMLRIATQTPATNVGDVAIVLRYNIACWPLDNSLGELKQQKVCVLQ